MQILRLLCSIFAVATFLNACGNISTVSIGTSEIATFDLNKKKKPTPTPTPRQGNGRRASECYDNGIC